MSEGRARPVLVGVVWACVWIHLALGTLVAGFLQLAVNEGGNWSGPGTWSGLGLLDRWALYSLENPQVYFWALLAGDVAALVLLWRGLSPASRRLIAWVYLTWLTLIVSAHLAASVYFNVIVGSIRTPDSTIYGGGWSDVMGTAVADSMVAFPAVLVAFALWRLRARRHGLCAACGYDLAGLKDERCPECGAVRAQRQRV